jgi:DNA invertase Pin-like site-specific DNA recombinase
MRAALYARVSTRDQKSIPDQLADLRSYAALKEFSVVAEYQEKESGKRDTRPVRYELLKRAWKREFDVVLVWKLDRWGRNVQDLVNTVTDLGNHNVAFVSFSDNIDLTTANGRLFFHMLCAFAQFERETIVDRVRAGVKKKRERWKEIGRTWGRPPKAREKSAEVMALMRDGKSKSAIAKQLKISRASVLRILRDAIH